MFLNTSGFSQLKHQKLPQITTNQYPKKNNSTPWHHCTSPNKTPLLLRDPRNALHQLKYLPTAVLIRRFFGHDAFSL